VKSAARSWQDRSSGLLDHLAAPRRLHGLSKIDQPGKNPLDIRIDDWNTSIKSNCSSLHHGVSRPDV
jgi:hypothetical protein